MNKHLETEAFLSLSENNTVIDIRSPNEYLKGHIPTAVSLPLFSNEERAKVGTLYKSQGRQAAIKKGLELVGPKMKTMISFAEGLEFKEALLVHCWRGGMRSESIALLFHLYGLPVLTLQGGYKQFRNHVLRSFERSLNLTVLAGHTGAGKTEILGHLKRLGEQVLDLEGLAHHRGSSFGGIGQPDQPTTEQFENDLYYRLRQLDQSRRIWVEDESYNIGKVFLPSDFYRQKQASPWVRVEMSQALRIERLVRSYGRLDRLQLQRSVIRIRKRLGDLRCRQCLQAIDKGHMEHAAALLLHYYDKTYKNALARRGGREIFSISVAIDDLESTAKAILEAADRMTRSE